MELSIRSFAETFDDRVNRKFIQFCRDGQPYLSKVILALRPG